MSKKASDGEPNTDAGIFAKFRLGFGVDGSNPSPFRDAHEKILSIPEDLLNIECITNRREEPSYEEPIISIKDYDRLVKSSVDSEEGETLVLPVEAEYARERSRNMTAQGMLERKWRRRREKLITHTHFPTPS